MKKRKSAVFDVVGYIVLFLIVLIVVLPLFWLIVSSFKSDADVIKWPPHFFPSEWVATQYRYVMKAIPVLGMLKNTVIFAGCVTVISLFFDSLAAYAFSRMQFRGRKGDLQYYFTYNDDSVSGHHDSAVSGGVQSEDSEYLSRTDFATYCECLWYLHADLIFLRRTEIAG